MVQTVARLKRAGIVVSMFIDPELPQVRASRQAGADAIELHTGTYCEAFRTGKYEAELAKIRAAAAFGASIGLKVFAGHGLDVRNIVPILEVPRIEEFNIGHSIIARAVFLGLPAAVKEIADLIHFGGGHSFPQREDTPSHEGGHSWFSRRKDQECPPLPGMSPPGRSAPPG